MGLILLDYAGGFYYTLEELCETLNACTFGQVTRYHRALQRDFVISAEQVWKELATAPLVVIDEVGSRGHVTPNSYSVFLKLLTLREGTPHVVLSNLCMEALEVPGLYDHRITSRLRAGTVRQLVGPDLRQSH